MFNIKKILDNLRVGMEIPHEFVFLQKYDKNKNSIFDKEEIESLSKELTESANCDDDYENLSEDEILDFYNKSFNKKQKASAEMGVEEFVKSWFTKITGNTPDIMSKVEKSEEYNKMSKTKQECVKILVNNTMRLHASDADDYMTEFFTSFYLNYTEDELQKLLPVLRNLDKIPTFDIANAEMFMWVFLENSNNITSDRADYIINRALYNTISGEGLIELFKLDDDSFEQSKKYLEVNEFKKLSNYTEMITFLIQNPEYYEKMLDLCTNFDINHIDTKILKTTDEEYEKIKQNARRTYLINGEENYVGIDNAFSYMSNLREEEIAYMINLMSIERAKSLDVSDAYKLAGFKNESLDNFIKENPNFQIAWSSYACNRAALKTPENNTEYIFDKKCGLVETRIIDIDRDKNETVIQTNNTQCNIHQTTKYAGVPVSSDFCDVISDVANYYDDKGNLIKSVITDANKDLKGLPTQYIVYADGRKETLQYATYNSNDKSRYTERHFESPSGVKSDYTYEESPDGMRIIDYTIKTSDGKTILDVHNTFRKVSENHYISSSNGHIYDITYDENSVNVIDSTNPNKIHNISFEGKLDKEKGGDVMAEILKIIPGNELFFINKLPLNKLIYNEKEHSAYGNNGVWNPEAKYIEIGKNTKYSITEIETLQNIFLHEFGHYLETDSDEENKAKFVISTNQKVKDVFSEELEDMIVNTTSVQQSFMNHILNDSDSEKTADVNAILYSQEPFGTGIGLRILYYMTYFPKTIATIAELIRERETEML